MDIKPNMFSFIYGYTDDFDGFVSSVSSFASLLDVSILPTEDILPTIARRSYGVFKADAWVAHEGAVTITFSYDTESKIATMMFVSPSPVPIYGNETEGVASLLASGASLLRDCRFIFLGVDNKEQVVMRKQFHPGLMFYSETKDMVEKDFIISQDRIHLETSIIGGIKIDGMKSSFDFALSYMKELKDNIQVSDKSSLSDLFKIISDIMSKEDEYEQMVNLEFGPLDNILWQAYCAYSQTQNMLYRQIVSMYQEKSVGGFDSMALQSPFTVRTLSYLASNIDSIILDSRPLLEKSLDLSAVDLKTEVS